MIKRKNEVISTELMKKISGVTILEMLLALAIISVILAMVSRQFTVAQNDSNAQQLEATVSKLFQTAANYYYGNCRQQVDPSTGLVPGAATVATLDPLNNPAVPFPVMNQMSPASNLLTTGNYFISGKDWPPSPNSYVDGTTDDHGYVVQFNQGTTIPTRSPSGIYSTWETASGSTGGAAIQSNPSYVSPPVPVANIYVWRIQVSVKLAPSLVANALSFKERFAADCLSQKTGNSVDPCYKNNTGPYLVWERLPSFAAPRTATNYWLTMPGVKEFNQLYTNDDIYGAENPTNWATQTGGATGTNNNYLCGG